MNNFMIEVSDAQYWKAMNYHDGILYCSLLTIDGIDGWRLPTLNELRDINLKEYNTYQFIDNMVRGYWVLDWPYSQSYLNTNRNIIPVRDL